MIRDDMGTCVSSVVGQAGVWHMPRPYLYLLTRITIVVFLLCLVLCLASTSHAATKPTLGGTRTLDTSHSLANGLVGVWLFNENSGSTAVDSTSNDNDEGR